MREREELIRSVNHCIDSMTDNLHLFVTITYRSPFHKLFFRRRDYVDVYADNRMLKRMINHEFYRNIDKSSIQYLFFVERHQSNDLHIHLLHSLPDHRFVRDKYKNVYKSDPLFTCKQILDRSVQKYKEFGRFEVNREIYDIRNLKSYCTKEVRKKEANMNCIDFENCTFDKFDDLPREPLKI